MQEWLERIVHIMNDMIPFNRFLGVRVAEVREGFAALELPFRPDFVGNPLLPALHGGVMSTLLDTCGGAAVWTQIDEADSVSTVDLRVDYLRPGPLADLRCEGIVQRLGNRVGVVDMKLFAVDNPERLIATGKGVYNVRRASEQ